MVRVIYITELIYSHKFIFRFKMRRQLGFADFSDSSAFKFSVEGGEGHKSIAINTDQFKMKDISIQTILRNSLKQDFSSQIDPHQIYMQIQKDQIQNSPQKPQKNNEDQQQQNGHQSEENMKKLIKFVKKIGPLMEEELKQNLPIYRFGFDDEPKFFRKESRLVVTLENLENVTEETLDISDLSWNSTGVVVAAAFAKSEHSGACNHKSMICLWGLYKRNFKPTKPQVISTPNCINCLSFHPKKPSVFACGSYTGQILLYDYSKNQEQLLAKTIVDDYFHRDLVSQISWWSFRPPGKLDTNYNILSLGTDGKILLWEVPNQAIVQDAHPQRVKNLLRYPIKGFLMLRKKQGAVVPVSGLTMNQSKINRNIFMVGSQGGSILRATLNPINHYINHESKALLDLQQTLKFKQNVYPFLLNLLPKHLPQIKNYLEQYCSSRKIKEIQSVSQIFSTYPEIRSLYPNPITFAYQPMAFPISSISDNKHGLYIVNAYEGYSRVYLENHKISLQAIQEGYQWAWIQGSHLMGGFIGQEWVVVDWTTGSLVWTVGVGQGLLWKEHGSQIGVVCQKTKIKILQLGDKLLGPFGYQKAQQIGKKIDDLKMQ